MTNIRTELKQQRVEELAHELIELLSTDEPELLEDYADNPSNWQVQYARGIASEMLRVSKANGLGGCWLCQG